MTIKIPNNRRLTDDERSYLLMRGEEPRVKAQDERYPLESEEVEDEEDLDEEEEEGDNYDSWTYAELTAEVKKRKEAGEEISPASQKQADLIAALRENDDTE